MIEINEKDKCCGCYACYNICPKNAIEMKSDEKGFKYPFVDKEKCINCGLCEKVCPIINKVKIDNEPKAYACINKDDKVRSVSSSGGIFTLLAENILSKNGIIFGAAFDKDMMVKHFMIDKLEDLYKFRGSKYVQSQIGDTYKLAKKELDEGKFVLFTGTPCQIEGLKLYLMKDYDKLYTQDIICHGVPSPLVWEKYKNNIEDREKDKIINFNFRNKENSWKSYDIDVKLNNDISIKEKASNNLYMKAFLKNICLRDSCYSCAFKSINRISDITLADYWGVQKLKPTFDDDKGTSLVVVNSKKGEELFENIKNKIKYEESNIGEASKYNPSMIKASALPNNRETFFKDIYNMDIESAIKRNLPKEKLNVKIKRKIKGSIKKILIYLKLYK